jgi:hypothetical protein
VSAQPQWAPVDDETADLLALVADEGHVSADFEWARFLVALRNAALADGGLIRPNRLRPLVRGTIAPRRIGAFTNRAKAEGRIVATGEWEISDDTEGRNSGKPARVYRWVVA